MKTLEEIYMEIQGKKRINEGLLRLYNFNYTIPESIKELFFDFYFISVFNEKLINDNKKINKFYSDSDILNLEYAINITKEKIVNYLQKILLKDLYKSIVYETRHCKNYNTSNINNKMKSFLEQNDKNKRTIEDYKSKDPGREIVLSLVNSIWDYNNEAFDFINQARIIFRQPQNWEKTFGGRLWAEACKAWIELYKSQEINDKTVWIDHVMDLEHNTGQILNKIPKFQGHWVQQMLNHKKNITSLTEFENLISDKMVELYHLFKKLFSNLFFSNPIIINNCDKLVFDETKLRNIENITFKQNSDRSYDIIGNLDIPYIIEKINIKLNKVTGNLDCSFSQIRTLTNWCPKIVTGNFNCNNTIIASLRGCPEYVGGDFNCTNTNIISLKGCPKIVKKNFLCYDTLIENLEGIGNVKGKILSYNTPYQRNNNKNK